MYYLLLQMMTPLLLCRQRGEEPTKRLMEYGTAGEMSVLPSNTAACSKHNNHPRCLRAIMPACNQLGDTLAAST